MFELWKADALDFSAILLETYKDLGLTETEYVFFVMLAKMLKTNPTGWNVADLAQYLTIGESGVAGLLMNGLGQGFIEVTQKADGAGRRFEEYSLIPLFGKVETAFRQKNRKGAAGSKEELFNLLERDFGLLSPKDIETAHMWLDDDGFDPEIIKLALMEMKSNQITSIKYVDKILLDWKKKNVTTVEGAKRQMIEFRNRRAESTIPQDGPKADPNDYYDWMGEI
ncbi:MAG: DnaD domain protein [Turicibacter sp.]|nr:DnaD domain protein [Turicibacter sp.]